MSDLIEITGLWAGKTKDGKRMFSGRMGRAKVLIFENGYKAKDTHPDMVMFLAKHEPPDKQRDEPDGNGEPEGPISPGTQPDPDGPDGIPF